TRFSRDWSSDVCSSDLLGRLGTAAIPAVPALTKILKDPSVQARWAAAKSLWAIGPAAAAAVPALIESLGDQSWVVRWSAARALRSEERRVGNRWRARRT